VVAADGSAVVVELMIGVMGLTMAIDEDVVVRDRVVVRLEVVRRLVVVCIAFSMRRLPRPCNS
jgi:hypothetical protein